MPDAPDPPALHAHAMDNIRFIRETMERAGPFTAVPGWGGVLMGFIALGASAIAGSLGDARWLVIGLATATVCVGVGFTAMVLKARASTARLFAAFQRFALAYLPGLRRCRAHGGVRRRRVYGEAACVWLLLWTALAAGAMSVRIADREYSHGTRPRRVRRSGVHGQHFHGRQVSGSTSSSVSSLRGDAVGKAASSRQSTVSGRQSPASAREDKQRARQQANRDRRPIDRIITTAAPIISAGRERPPDVQRSQAPAATTDGNLSVHARARRRPIIVVEKSFAGRMPRTENASPPPAAGRWRNTAHMEALIKAVRE